MISMQAEIMCVHEVNDTMQINTSQALIIIKTS